MSLAKTRPHRSHYGQYLLQLADASYNLNELYGHLKDKNITEVRRWIVNNLDNDPVRIFRRIYDSLYDYLDSSTIPHAVVILGEYQFKSYYVADQEINQLAFFIEFMEQVKFK